MKLQKIIKMYTSFENNMENLLLSMTMKNYYYLQKIDFLS